MHGVIICGLRDSRKLLTNYLTFCGRVERGESSVEPCYNTVLHEFY
jgi:hypothetical protein